MNQENQLESLLALVAVAMDFIPASPRCVDRPHNRVNRQSCMPKTSSETVTLSSVNQQPIQTGVNLLSRAMRMFW